MQALDLVLIFALLTYIWKEKMPEKNKTNTDLNPATSLNPNHTLEKLQN